MEIIGREGFKKPLIIGTIMVVVLTVVNNTLWILVPGANFPVSLLAPFLMIFLISLIGSIKTFRLTKGEIALIYSMLIASLGWGFIPSFWLAQAAGLAYIPRLKSIVIYWVPELWTPKSNLVLRGFFLGGTAIPWSTWITPLFFWIALALSWAFILFSASLVFARIFVDLEKLPFPLATIPISIIGEGSEAGARRYLRDPGFIGGFLLAFLFTLPDIINAALNNPEFLPSLTALLSVDWLEVFPEARYVLKGSVLYTAISPLMFSFAYLLPIDILLTQWLTFILLMVVLPVIDINFLHPERFREYVNSPGYAWDMTISPAYGVWRTEALTLIGGIYGLALFHIVFNWHNIRNIVRDIVTGSRKNISYGLSTILCILSTAVLLALLISSGVPLAIAIITMLLMLVSSVGMSVIRASGGGNPLNGLVIGGESNRLFSLALLYDAGGMLGAFNPRPSPTPSQQCFVSLQTAIALNGEAMAWNPLVLGVESYKVCSQYKVDVNKTFLFQALSILIAILIAFPLALWTFYTNGLENLIYVNHSVLRELYAEAYTRDLTIYYTNISPLNVQLSSPYLPQTIAGMIITIVLLYLRMVKPGFPLNPIGYVLGGSFFTYQWWTSFFVAWIVKWVVIKVGGTRLYKKTLDIVLGMIMGSAFSLLVLWAASLITFFAYA